MTNKGKKIMEAMRKEYGSKKGEKVFYASKNKGAIKGVEKQDKKGMQVESMKKMMMK